jgi:hypothetical protein
MIATVLATCLLAQTAPATPSLHPKLEPFRPLIGKTFKGNLGAADDRTSVDVSRYERAMNGMAIRTMHSVNDGEYGGETLIYWDSRKEKLAFIYVTTAGFQTTGTITAEPGKYSSLEEVNGEANGITKVRGTAEFKGDGILTVKSEYFKDGVWSPGRTATYREDATAQVIFR